MRKCYIWQISSRVVKVSHLIEIQLLKVFQTLKPNFIFVKMKPFLNLAYADKIGFTGQFLIEPKPKEPTKHQYDYGKTLLHTLNKYDWFLASRNKCPHSCSNFSLTTVKVDNIFDHTIYCRPRILHMKDVYYIYANKFPNN